MRSHYEEILQYVKNFEYDSTYGYLNSDVWNCGSGFELRLFFEDASNLKQDLANDFEKEITNDMQCRIFNKIKLNTTPSSLVTKFVDLLKTFKVE